MRRNIAHSMRMEGAGLTSSQAPRAVGYGAKRKWSAVLGS